ncbi:HAD family phosphatase [Candidatus Woesearchaeota archaeon]|nr:HAD family phosphatase [Candidatus Woesearchaeota archaeon]
MSYRALIFDWGGVLIDNPAQALLDYCATRFDTTRDELKAVLDPHFADFQRGRIEEDTLWEIAAMKLGCEKPKIFSLWGEAFRCVYQPKSEMFDLVREVRAAGYKTGFLSNTEEAPRRFFAEQGYHALFDATVFSCAEGIVKPETAIYLLELERLGVKANKSVFIDDNQTYVDGARAVGITGILFESPQQVRQELQKLGFKI